MSAICDVLLHLWERLYCSRQYLQVREPYWLLFRCFCFFCFSKWRNKHFDSSSNNNATWLKRYRDLRFQLCLHFDLTKKKWKQSLWCAHLYHCCGFWFCRFYIEVSLFLLPSATQRLHITSPSPLYQFWRPCYLLSLRSTWRRSISSIWFLNRAPRVLFIAPHPQPGEKEWPYKICWLWRVVVFIPRSWRDYYYLRSPPGICTTLPATFLWWTRWVYSRS